MKSVRSIYVYILICSIYIELINIYLEFKDIYGYCVLVLFFFVHSLRIHFYGIHYMYYMPACPHDDQTVSWFIIFIHFVEYKSALSYT